MIAPVWGSNSRICVVPGVIPAAFAARRYLKE